MRLSLRILALGLFIINSACAAAPYNTDPTKMKSELVSTDCSVDVETCEYYAAAETASYFYACPKAFNKKFPGSVSKEDEAMISSWLNNWYVMKKPELKAALTDPANKVVTTLRKAILENLISGPADDMGIECSRLGMVQEDLNKPAEDMSDVLQGTKNYDTWHARRHPELQKLPSVMF